MERRIQNTTMHFDDDSLENMFNGTSSRFCLQNGRPLTSTGRRRQNFLDSEDDSQNLGNQHYHSIININEDEGNASPLNSFRLIRLPNSEEESSRGLPSEMIDRIKRMKMGKSGKDCTICYNGYKQGEKIRKLPCKHIFHDGCILPWFEKNITCPNCRFNLFEYYLEESGEEQ